jgi:hypothetical protein
MNKSFELNGNKVSLREYLEFRLLAIENRLDDLCIQINDLKLWQSKDEGKSSGVSITVMYMIIILNLILTSISLAQKFIK